MKALKFSSIFLIVALFSLAQGYAQDNNNGKGIATYSFDVNPDAFFLECIDDEVSGTIYGESTWFKNSKIQEKWSGELKGKSGDVYTLKMVKNSNWKDWVMGTTFVTNNIWTITLFNETKGIPVGVVHFNTNLTIKTDGDFVNEVSNMKVECY